jgi:hypothetical protein
MGRDEEENHASNETSPLVNGLTEEQPQFPRRNPNAPDATHGKANSLSSIRTGPRKTGHHHRHKSSLSQLFASMSGGLGVISEEVQLEAKNLIKEELTFSI